MSKIIYADVSFTEYRYCVCDHLVVLTVHMHIKTIMVAQGCLQPCDTAILSNETLGIFGKKFVKILSELPFSIFSFFFSCIGASHINISVVICTYIFHSFSLLHASLLKLGERQLPDR